MFSFQSDFLGHSLIASSASADLRTLTFILLFWPRLKSALHFIPLVLIQSSTPDCVGSPRQRLMKAGVGWVGVFFCVAQYISSDSNI